MCDVDAPRLAGKQAVEPVAVDLLWHPFSAQTDDNIFRTERGRQHSRERFDVARVGAIMLRGSLGYCKLCAYVAGQIVIAHHQARLDTADRCVENEILRQQPVKHRFGGLGQ